MREAFKVLSVVVLLFAKKTAAVAWFTDRPSSIVNLMRYVCPVLCVLAIAFFLKIHFRGDDAPDYLRQHVGKYFTRDGFCFGIVPKAISIRKGKDAGSGLATASSSAPTRILAMHLRQV